MEHEQFEAWLGARQIQPGKPEDLGAVLLWRDHESVLQHAAVSLGDGLVFHKEAQTWWTPRQVVRLEDVFDRWQEAGEVEVVSLSP